MLRISKGKETLTLKGDHLETNFQGFYQKSLHWRPRSPMETSVHNPARGCLDVQDDQPTKEQIDDEKIHIMIKSFFTWKSRPKKLNTCNDKIIVFI